MQQGLQQQLDHAIDSLPPEVAKSVKEWLAADLDPKMHRQIEELLLTKPSELCEGFYTKLTFGTAGLRGIMGVGTNRLNCVTIGLVTQGLANYILQQLPQGSVGSVFIGYDSRNHSREFAEEAALILAGNGIEAYITNSLVPTPQVSWGCRLLHTTAAIMITASHNPPQYNGYKVYWSDGGQVLPPHDTGILQQIQKLSGVKSIRKSTSLSDPKIHWVGKELDSSYLEAIQPLQLYPDEDRKFGARLKVVYTSLHGTGIRIMPEALTQWGFTSVEYVTPQIVADGDFPTAPSPNPEEPSALQLGVELMRETGSDLLIATDPDGDRLGVALQDGENVILLNGNQILTLCLEEICRALQAQGKLPHRAAVVKTIVTSQLFNAIATRYGVACFEVLTGFKYIARMIAEWIDAPKGYNYLFGGEESYGSLYGTQVRDKDAILAALIVCEIALKAKLEGQTLQDRIYAIYKLYGPHFDKVRSAKLNTIRSAGAPCNGSLFPEM